MNLDENIKTTRFSSDVSMLSRSRSESLSLIITKAILEGHWLPGDRINDQELSDETKISRISVREALSFLVERGIVEKVHWKGYFVRKLSIKEIESIIEVRVALEELAIKKMLSIKEPRVFEKMKEAIDISEKLIDTSSYQDYMDADIKFHELIYEASGNVWIKNIIDDLRLHINILRNLSMQESFTNSARISIDDHRRLLDQFIKGNEKKALEILYDHFNKHLQNIKKTYNSKNNKELTEQL